WLNAVPVVAHHEIAAKFDDNKPVTIKGTISKIDWLNPHVHIYVDVHEAATVLTWAVELESPVDLKKGGWTRESLKLGDAITVRGISARDGTRQAWAKSVAMTDGGKAVLTIPAASAPRNAQAAQPVPRWPDGQPRLGP